MSSQSDSESNPMRKRMFRRLPVLVLIAALAFAIGTFRVPPSAEAHDNVDQSSGYAGYSIGTHYAMVFVPQQNNIVAFDVYHHCNQFMTFTIRPWTRTGGGYGYAGADLFPGISFISNNGVNHVDIPGGPVTLTPGATYELVDISSETGYECVGGGPGSTYGPGDFLYGGYWEWNAYDLYFVTYYQAVSAADVTPPDTTVSGPTSPTNATSATFTFSGTDDVTAPGSLTFECQFDNGGFASCTSPATYSSLGEGSHTFEVRARDAADNVDASPAIFNWSIDLTPSTVTLDSMPVGPTNSTTATFAFHASEPSTTLECQLDGGGFGVCTAPATYPGLLDGQHTFDVRATDQAGNEGNATSFTWTIDTQAPDTLIDTAPAPFTNSNTALFTFHATEGATFTCQRGNQTPAPCTSPVTYSGLGDGHYTFSVTATDAVGNADPSTASIIWVVDTVAPDTSITTGPADSSITTTTTATFEFTGTDDVTAAADLTFACSLDGAAFGPCTSGGSYSNLSRAQHTFAVRAMDQAGNGDPSPASRTWTITKLTPVLTWATPADITYPTALSGTQLNATASVAGSSTYGPAAGTVLSAGNGQTLHVDFTPTDAANYNTTSKNVTINVLKATPTITFGAAPTPIYGGGNFTVSATTNSNGALSYSAVSGPCAVVSVSAGTFSSSGAGTCVVRASAAATTNFNAASTDQSVSIAQASQTITFSPPPNVKLPQSPVTVSATASSGLTVTFTTTTPAVCTSGGTNGATITLLATGTCTVVAHQPGNTNYSAAADVAQSFTVGNGKADQTITFASLADRTLAQSPVTVSATASSGLTVIFITTTPAVCTSSGKSGATISLLAEGTCRVKADQGGNAGYNPAPSVTQSFAVTKANQTITFLPLRNRSLAQSPFTVSATASSGLTVIFTTTTPAVCTSGGKSGATIKLIAVGTCTVKADQTGNATYNPAPSVTQSFSVTP